MAVDAVPDARSVGRSSGLDDALLAAYVPALILEQLAQRGEGLHTAELSTLHGALLYADISGFTALTERLMPQGPAGVERLVQRLNAYFDRLIEVLLDHGGDVLKFAGDTLIVLFPDRDGAASAESVQHAAAAALVAQVALLDLRECANGLVLALKIAIASGELSCALVGGERARWEMVVFGEPMEEASAAALHCAAGAVVLAISARSRLDAEARVREVGHGVHQLMAIAPTVPVGPRVAPQLQGEAALAAWSLVPYAIRSRLAAGEDEWLADLRPLTVIFATLPGHAEAVGLDRFQALMCQLQQLIYEVEGSVNKVSVDDKGLSLIAVLGMPPFAHADDPHRGLRLAQRMRALFEAEGLRPSIGVTTGPAFCGVIGSRRRREYSTIGDVVNLAARLMVASQGGLLCDQATRDSVAGCVDFGSAPPLALRLKGKAELIPAWRP
jgi:class 3 adenylate cyclase